MKKIVFVYDMKLGTPWKDGLWAALELLKKDYEVVKINMHGKITGISEEDFKLTTNADLYLGWGSFNSSPLQYICLVKQANITTPLKTGFCVGGTGPKPNGLEYLDVLFYETEWHGKQINHPNKYHAFGVNTDIFHTTQIQSQKIWDYIGVGAFASWKRWHYMLKKPGRRLVIGHYQQDQLSESNKIVHDLMVGGVMVCNELVAETLADFYRASKIAYIPNMLENGGERAVLEARACGIEVEVENDNPKLKTLLECPIYDQHYYYQQLKKGIESVI